MQSEVTDGAPAGPNCRTACWRSARRRAGDDRQLHRVGSGPRAFSLSAPFVEMQTAGEMVGRIVFALGAVIVWIYIIALTVGTVRKLFDRNGG